MVLAGALSLLSLRYRFYLLNGIYFELNLSDIKRV